MNKLLIFTMTLLASQPLFANLCLEAISLPKMVVSKRPFDLSTSVNNAASKALHKAVKEVKRNLRLTEDPIFIGNSDPQILITGLRHDSRGEAILSIVARQTAFDYTGSALVSRSGNRFIHGLDVVVSANIVERKGVLNTRWLPAGSPAERSAFRIDRVLNDVASSALRSVAGDVQFAFQLTREPTFADNVDPQIFITGFRHNRRGEPILSIIATQAAFDHAGAPLVDQSGHHYTHGLEISVSADVAGESAKNIQWLR